MYTAIQDRVPIRNDYKGAKIVGYLKKNEVVEPIRIIDNWIMFISNDKYVWVRMYDKNVYYILDINPDKINRVNGISFNSSVLDPYINSKL